MRTKLPEIRRTAHRRARSNEISGQKPVSRLPSRSGRHRGAAECVDQTFPNNDMWIDEQIWGHRLWDTTNPDRKSTRLNSSHQ